MPEGAEKNSGAPGLAERELVLTRVFDAPRETVFACWTQREHLQRWWGPHRFTNPVCEVDPRPGGTIRIVMRGPDGLEHVTKGTFEEVIPPERLSFTNNAEDASGRPLLEGFTTVTFEDLGGKTKLTLRTRVRGLVDFAPRMLEGMEAGWSQSLERLAEEAAGPVTASYANVAPAFEMSRVFDAPRELVYKAWTEAEQLKQWWGPKGCTIPQCTLDLRVGGSFHYCLRFPDGRELWGKWIFDEIKPPEILAFTSVFADDQGNAVKNPWRPDWPMETPGVLIFEDLHGKTKLTMRVFLHKASDAERAAFEAGKNGFRQGSSGAWDQLEQYLTRAQQ